MRFGIDFSEPSTLRGVVWIFTAVTGLIMQALGKPIDQLTMLSAGLAGILGIGLKDK